MKILLTGASGFLGRICMPFLTVDHQVLSIGRNMSNDINADLATFIPELPPIDAVIHAAGKAHVYPRTEAEKQAFFDVNVNGTRHLLDALNTTSVKAFVFISSVSVYGLDHGENIPESTPLKGSSPYASSKIQAETMIVSWCQKHQVDYLILRLPLIAGAKPLGNLGKMMKAIQGGRYLRIAKGEANKSMVLATDVSALMAKWINSTKRVSGIYNLTDGIHPSFFQLEEGLRLLWHIKYIPAIPKWLGYLMGKIGDSVSWFPVNTGSIRKITGTFTFSDEKARIELGWNPRSVLDHLNELL